MTREKSPYEDQKDALGFVLWWIKFNIKEIKREKDTKSIGKGTGNAR